MITLNASPLLVHARTMGWLGDRAHLPAGTDADLLALLHHLARAGRLTRAELLGAALELSPHVDGRALALGWAQEAVRVLEGCPGTVQALHPAVTGSIKIVAQVLEGRHGRHYLEVAEAVAREAEAATARSPFLVREPARMALALAAPLPNVSAHEVAVSASAIVAHAAGVSAGLYRPEEDMGGYSPDWPTRIRFLDRCLEAVQAAMGQAVKA